MVESAAFWRGLDWFRGEDEVEREFVREVSRLIESAGGGMKLNNRSSQDIVRAR